MLKVNQVRSPKVASSMCGDTQEIRYQKALKEITKLISVNTELKEETIHLQEAVENLQQALQEKENYCSELTARNNNLANEVESLHLRCGHLQEENNNLVEKNSTYKKDSQAEVERMYNRIGQFETNVIEQQNSIELRKVIDDLESTIQQKNEVIGELMRKNDEDIRRSNKCGEKTKHSLNEGTDYERKLKAANNYIEHLNKECADLKSKFIKLENKNSLIQVKSEKKFVSPSKNHERINSNFSLKEDGGEILKRLKKVESQHHKLSRKFHEVSKDLVKAKESFEQSDKENIRIKQKLEKYEQLIEKQQNEIEGLIVSHDKDIQEMTEEFKVKLLEQRESFNPSKNGKTMKMMEGVQTQNKSLKKKFQLCSIQLTKCFKTLEIYKKKLAEYEQEYNDLMIEKEGLMEKLVVYEQGYGQSKSGRSERSKYVSDEKEGLEI